MSRFINSKQFKHDTLSITGVMLVNLGTPDAPTATALRRYLGEFLWDPRVVEIPRLLWWLILHGVILRIRPGKSAKAYQEIWMQEGSPLLVYSKKQAAALQSVLDQNAPNHYKVITAMRYGQPSIQAGLDELINAGASRILVLPLYPQYSATTTASVFDEVSKQLQKWRQLPEMRFVNQYHDFEPYIQAMANHIRGHWSNNGQGKKLVFSFHGIPKRCVINGDPYYCHCHKTARLLADALGLHAEQWMMAFQSRFGQEEWLKPYLEPTLREMPGQGINDIDVFCPGFSADCLETLEEIAIQNKAVFMESGGQRFQYIPALNDQNVHIEALAELVQQHTQAWAQEPQSPQVLELRKQRAIEQGAKV